MENNNNIDAIQERLNRIQNQIKEKEEREDEKFEDEEDQNNANVDLNKLKN